MVLSLEEPSGISHAYGKLILAIVLARAKDLLRTYLTGGIIGFHHEVGQWLPVETYAPHTYLAAGIHHLTYITLLLRIVVFVVCKGDNGRELTISEEGIQVYAYLCTVGHGH